MRFNIMKTKKRAMTFLFVNGVPYIMIKDQIQNKCEKRYLESKMSKDYIIYL